MDILCSDKTGEDCRPVSEASLGIRRTRRMLQCGMAWCILAVDG